MLGNHTALLHGLDEFREHLGGTLTITMLRGLGNSFEVHEVDSVLMRRAAAELA
jgi:3-dehydroquinate synthase